MTGPQLLLTSKQLRYGLESLPQELYNEIYTAVFTAAPGIRLINATNDRKTGFSIEDLELSFSHLPRGGFQLLHVSAATRALYATTFYGCDAVFEISATRGLAILAIISLSKLPLAHRNRLRKVIVDMSSGCEGIDLSRIDEHRKFWAYYIGTEVAKNVFVRVDGKTYG